jgi:aconitate hydratase
VVFPDVRWRIERGDKEIPVEVDGRLVITLLDVSDRQRQHLLAGGTLNFVKNELRGSSGGMRGRGDSSGDNPPPAKRGKK